MSWNWLAFYLKLNREVTLRRELGEAEDRDDREDESQSPGEDGTEDCSSDGDTHVEGEVRQHCARDVASCAVKQQR